MRADAIRTPFRCAVPFGLLLALGGCMATGQSETPTAGSYLVASGKPTALEKSYLTLDRRCRPRKGPTAIVTEPPEHGSVRIVQRKSEAVYGPGPYQHCNGALAPALAFEYTSRPGYRGRDALSVRVRYADGELRTDRFAVGVY